MGFARRMIDYIRINKIYDIPTRILQIISQINSISVTIQYLVLHVSCRCDVLLSVVLFVWFASKLKSINGAQTKRNAVCRAQAALG